MSWYERRGGMQRLMVERNLLDGEYPGFTLDVCDDGTVFGLGFIGPNRDIGARYEVLIQLPHNYGTGAIPRVTILEPEMDERAPHRFNDGSLCLEHEDAFSPRSTVVTLLGWVTAWLILYEGWKETGQHW